MPFFLDQFVLADWLFEHLIFSHALGRSLEKVFTQGRVVCQARGAGERFLRFTIAVQQMQQMPPCCPIRLVIHTRSALICSSAANPSAGVRARASATARPTS